MVNEGTVILDIVRVVFLWTTIDSKGNRINNFGGLVEVEFMCLFIEQVVWLCDSEGVLLIVVS